MRKTQRSRIPIPKDWYLNADKIKKERTLLLIEQAPISNVADLPQLLNAVAAADVLKMSVKTTREFLTKGIIKSVRIRGRRFTTPQWIADFLLHEMVVNG